jgi:hypothetical protein
MSMVIIMQLPILKIQRIKKAAFAAGDMRYD